MENRLQLTLLAFGLAACSSAPAAPKAPAEAAPPAPAPSCTHDVAADTALLKYEAFGPAAMSYALLGQAWWQWDSEGHAFDEDGGVVWVVVHDGVDADALARRFPVDPTTRCDHRYVALGDARSYLQKNMSELEDVPELASVAQTLRDTLTALDGQFESSP